MLSHQLSGNSKPTSRHQTNSQFWRFLLLFPTDSFFPSECPSGGLGKIGKGEGMRLLIALCDETIQFTSLKYGGADDKEIILVDMKYWHNSHTNHIQYLSKPAACLLWGARQLLLLRFDEQSPLYSTSINGLVNKLAGFCSRQRGICKSEAFQMDRTWVVRLYTSPVTLLTALWFQKCH